MSVTHEGRRILYHNTSTKVKPVGKVEGQAMEEMRKCCQCNFKFQIYHTDSFAHISRSRKGREKNGLNVL